MSIAIEDEYPRNPSAVPVEIKSRVRIIVHAGAVGQIIRRKDKHSPAICTGIQPVTWNGRKYSRYEIAEGTGISRSMITKIFNATRKPSLTYAMRLATYFRVSIDTLLMQILPRVEIKRL